MVFVACCTATILPVIDAVSVVGSTSANGTWNGSASWKRHFSSFAVFRYFSCLLVLTLRFWRRYVVLLCSEFTHDSHKMTFIELVGSRIVTSCLLSTPWRKVGIFFTPDTCVTSAFTVTSCSAATWARDEIGTVPFAVKVSEYVNGRWLRGVNLVWLSRMMSPVLVLLKLVTVTGVFVTCKVLSSVCFCDEKQTTLTASSFFCRIYSWSISY